MSTLELPPRAGASVSASDLGGRGVALTLEQLAYLALIALAAVTRLWGLDNRALHHDETLHAFFSWTVLRGQGYVHDPLLHGPFLYFFGALVYMLFGDSDATARLGPALFGVALVGMPYFLRRELGRGAALIAAALILISPVFMYIGRFIRHDPYGVLFELVALVGVVRYVGTRRPAWLYASAAALGLMAANMETFYLYLAIWAPVVIVALLWRVWRGGAVVAGAMGLLLAALVLVLPGAPERPTPESDTVVRASGAYVCPSAGQPYPPANPIQVARPGPLFGWPPLETADNNYALCARHEPDNDVGLYLIKLGQFLAHPAIIAALALALAGPAVLYWQIGRRRGADGRTAWERARDHEDDVLAAFASLGQGRRWLLALLAFFVPYALLFSSFFTNPVGVISGASGSLIYWLAQHEVQRGGQPAHYYAALLAIYEPLIALWGLVGIAMVVWQLAGRLRRARAKNQEPRTKNQEPRTRDQEPRTQNQEPNADDLAADEVSASARPTPGSRFLTLGSDTVGGALALPALLAWWAVTTFGLYSWAGEKMPWLTIHLALPLALLGGWALARTLSWARDLFDAADAAPADDAPAWRSPFGSTLPPVVGLPPLVIYLGVFAAIAVLCFLLIAVIADTTNPQASWTPWVPLLGLLLVTLLTIGSGLLRGARWAIGALALGLTLVLGMYGVRSAFQLSFAWGDVPREMMIYTQTSPDVRRVIDRLEQASTRRGGGLDMVVWYDNETVWDWYMRRFDNAAEQPPTLEAAPGEDVQAVLMLWENYVVQENADKLAGFSVQRYPLRWWFPEEQAYRMPKDWFTAPVDDNSPLLMRALREPFDTRTAVQFWQYMIYRVPPAPLGSTDFVIAVRPELATEIGLGTGGDQ